MTTVTVHDAKTHFSRLLAAVEAGEEFTIARRDKAVAKLVPITPKERPTAKPGAYKGLITIPDSFFDPMTDEELSEWYDGPVSPD